MSDVIERLLEVEQRARRIIADAEAGAAQTIDRAREEARTIVEQGREEARRQAEQLVSSNAQALAEGKDRCLAEAKAGLPSADALGQDALERAARFAVNVIAYGTDTDQ